VTTLIAVAALSALIHVRAEYRGPRWQVYLFKPLTTTLLLLAAVLAPAAHGPGYRVCIAAGLGCSLVGDILLMLPRDRFLAGLGTFLLAHLAYVAGFGSRAETGVHPTVLIPLLAAALVLLRMLWPGLGRLRAPVLIYTVVILVMVWTAWSWQLTRSSPGATLAAAGATLFMGSDAILALNRFQRPFRSAQALVMSTYVAAQALISLSVGVA
jgi:uncharacterized membrane protein YhhN